MKPLVITNPSIGIGPSVHLGFGDMRNMDITSIPGVAQMNNVAVKQSAAVVDKQPLWIVQDPATPANFYALDITGGFYKSTDSGDSWTATGNYAGQGQGLAIWKDYIFVAEDDKLHTYGPLSGSASAYEFKTDLPSDDLWHPMLVSRLDGKLYIGSGRYISTLEELTNFVDTTAATYTWTPQALDLPEDYRVKCLEELGNNLMLGTYQGTGDVRIADIFPWDGSSTTFGQPVRMEEYGVHAMKNINQVLYVIAGNQGKVFKSDGVRAYEIAQIPDYITNLKDSALTIEGYPGAIGKYKGMLIFGIGSDSAVDGMGVWSARETSQGTILNLEHGISSGNWGASNKLQVSAIAPVSDESMLIGWIDNATTGVDKTLVSGNKYTYTSAYSAYIDSPFYSVGSNQARRTFKQLEFQLAKDIAANEGIRIQYRVALDDSFTTIGTYTNADITGLSHQVVADIPSCEFVQIRIALTGTTTTPIWKKITLK